MQKTNLLMFSLYTKGKKIYREKNYSEPLFHETITSIAAQSSENLASICNSFKPVESFPKAVELLTAVAT